MSGVTLGLLGPQQDVKAHDKISYRETNISSPMQKANGCWSYFLPYWQSACQLVRNSFFLPHYNTSSSAHQIDERIAEKAYAALKLEETPSAKEARIIRDNFDIREVPVKIKDTTTRIFNVQIIESKEDLNGKKLRLIVFKFYGNKQKDQNGNSQKWDPMTIRELSESPFLVIKALRAAGIHVDSLMTTSLGAVTLSGLKYQTTDEECDLLPETLFINRGMASTRDVTNHLYLRPINYILYGVAKLFGWEANPEQDLLDFLEKQDPESLSQRKIMILETPNDFYFAGDGGFKANFHKKIEKLGVSVLRASLVPSELIQPRAHHALPLKFMTFNSETQILANTCDLPFDENETMSSFIVNNVFGKGTGKYHTSFIACGNDATTPSFAFQHQAESLLLDFAKKIKAQRKHLSSDAALRVWQ